MGKGWSYTFGDRCSEEVLVTLVSCCRGLLAKEKDAAAPR
jgi:hypothetical protein